MSFQKNLKKTNRKNIQQVKSNVTNKSENENTNSNVEINKNTENMKNNNTENEDVACDNTKTVDTDIKNKSTKKTLETKSKEDVACENTNSKEDVACENTKSKEKMKVSQKAPVPRKKGPNLADIKKALAEKQKAKEAAEKDAEEREKMLKLEKEKKEKEIMKKLEKIDIKKEENKVISKVPRYTFLRKDVIRHDIEEQKSTIDENKNAETTKSNRLNNDTKVDRSNDAFDKSVVIYKSPITCILGHVDTGKTKLLDKLRHTNVQLGEAGGITQQIGATFFPNTYLELNCKIKTQFPGILIIDTPGHESFTNLRSRGSSLCNIAILVIDIMHSLEPQTLESIEMLKMRKTPFVIALNKIDRIYEWKNLNEINKEKDHASTANELYEFCIKRQKKDVQLQFKKRLDDIMLALSEIGLNTALFSNNTDPLKMINIVPTSAMTGEGIPNLFSTILTLCEKYMKQKLTYNKNNFECTVLEVKNEEGHGITIDAILSNGEIREGDKICLCGFDGPIITNVKTILVPEACKESRTKSTLVSVKKANGSLGIKIAGANLDKVVCGTSVVKINMTRVKDKNVANNNGNKKQQVASQNMSIGIMSESAAKKMVMEELDNVLNSIQTQEVGVHLQASTLGSLEALLNFLKDKVPVSSISIGNVRKKDIIKASTMVEKKKEYALMLCFDIKVEKDMEEIANEMNVKIFTANIIYHLLEKYEKYMKELLERKKEEHKPVYPCKIKIIPNNVWNKRSPIVMGIEVEGILSLGTMLVREDGFCLGKVTSIENNKNPVKISRTGDKVAIKVETEDAPRMLGRHFEETDIFYSKITRQNIDVLKEYYKEELCENDWKLVIDLKRIFEII